MTYKKYVSFLARKILCNSIVYKIYEKILWNQIKGAAMPEHIGVILDGNRRWASEHSMPSWIGHQFGAEKVDDLLNWCQDLKVKTVTLYAFSTENFSRAGEEVQGIMRIFNERLKTVFSNERINRNRVKVSAIGRISLLPESTQKLIRLVEDRTNNFDQYYVNLAIVYGGRAEIVDAMKKIAKKVKAGIIDAERIDEKIIEEHLYTAHLPKSEPDLIIRTSGEERLSGFLLWQGAYSELCFVDVFWPDFRRIDLWRVIRTFQQRERRFGS